MAVDGTYLYIGTDDSDILARADPLTGVVLDVLTYDPPLNKGDLLEDGAYDAISGTLWRTMVSQNVLQNTTDGFVLATRPVDPAPPFHLLGLEWVDGTLYASTLHTPTFGILDDPFGAPTYRTLELSGIPIDHRFDGLAYDIEDGIMYMATRTTDRAYLWRFELGTLTATLEADLTALGYAHGAFADAIGWYNPDFGGYDPFLEVFATCPEGGPISVSWRGASADGTVGLVYADDVGAFMIPPTHPCAGTQLGLGSGGIRLVFQGDAGPDGSRTIEGVAPASVCGGWLQLVDASTCKTSGVTAIR